MLIDAAPHSDAEPRARTRAATAWIAVATFVGYVAMTWVGLALPVAEGVVSPVWAPAGIAVAGLVLGGLRLWPVVVFAAFVGNVISGSGVSLSAGISVGNGAEALVAAWLLRRVGFAPSMHRARDIAWLVPIAMVASAVSATSGVAQLWLRDYVTNGDLVERWMLWWSGDAMGMLVVAPFLCALSQVRIRRARVAVPRIIEFLMVHGAMAAISTLVFVGESPRFPALLVPLIAWSTVRFRAIGSSTAALVAGGIAISAIINGTFVFEGLTPTQSVQALQALVALVTLSTLMIGAALTESEQLRRKLERALADEQEVARHLRQIDETKDRLLAVVSHELRTPLTSILALASLLRDRIGAIEEAKLSEMYGMLVKEATRLDSLLTDLLDLERVRLGMERPTYETVDVAALVHAVVERYSHVQREICVEVDPVEVQADRTKLERIVDNLIGNALKHTPVDSQLAVTARAQDGGVLITVDDAGSGVPAHEREQIFEPFTRGAATSPSDVPGTGIGLSLVAQFADLHGGRAWVEDSASGGASFRVFIPAGPAPAPEPDSFTNGTDVVASPMPG